LEEEKGAQARRLIVHLKHNLEFIVDLQIPLLLLVVFVLPLNHP